jgi:hypothetical protein
MWGCTDDFPYFTPRPIQIMSDQPTPDTKNGTYYAKNREARKAYQLKRYHALKKMIARQRKLARELEPEKMQAYDEYQRQYYRKHRERILARKKEIYAQKQPRRSLISRIRNPES